MARNYAALPHDYLEEMELLTDAEFGRLCRALLQYSITGEMEELHGNERMYARRVMMQEDRFQSNYEEQYAARSARGKAGAQARWENAKACSSMISMQKNAQACLSMPSNAKHGNTETETETKTEDSCYATNARARDFDAFWSAYPKKVGKQSARKAFEKAKVPLETLLTAIERQKCSSQWSRDGGRYIPNPATWLNQGRWEDELPCDTGRSAQKDPLLEMIERGEFRDNGGNSEDPFDLT